MKPMIRCVSLVLAIIMLLAVPVNAAMPSDQVITPQASDYFSALRYYLYRVSDTKFEVWYEAYAVGTMQEIGVSMIKVQRSADGVNWSTMQTFTYDLTPSMMCYDTFSHTGYINYYGTPGYYYRAYIRFHAKNSNGTGELHRYTDSILL